MGRYRTDTPTALYEKAIRKISGIARGILEPMELNEQLDELLLLAEKLGIEVRKVHLTGDGGAICTIRGKKVLFVDKNAPLAEQLARTSAAIGSLGELEDQYILPEIRQILEEHRQKDIF